MNYINQQYTADCLSTCPLYINFISQLMQCSGLEVAGSSPVQDFEFDKHTLLVIQSIDKQEKCFWHWSDNTNHHCQLSHSPNLKSFGISVSEKSDICDFNLNFLIF